MSENIQYMSFGVEKNEGDLIQTCKSLRGFNRVDVEN